MKLSTGKVLRYRENKTVPSCGVVPGGGILLKGSLALTIPCSGTIFPLPLNYTTSSSFPRNAVIKVFDGMRVLAESAQGPRALIDRLNVAVVKARACSPAGLLGAVKPATTTQ